MMDDESAPQAHKILDDLPEPLRHDLKPTISMLASLTPDQAPPMSLRLQTALGAPVRRTHKRLVFTLALIGCLSAGTGTAAAVSPDFRAGAVHAINGVLHSIPLLPHPGSSHASNPNGTGPAPRRGPGDRITPTSHPVPPSPQASHTKPPQDKSTNHPEPSMPPTSHGKGKP